MNRLRECQQYIADWSLNGYVVTIEMDSDRKEDMCIQHMVVELLRDFIDNPWPEGFIEGSEQLNTWIDTALKRIMHCLGVDFGFSEEQEDQVKNLAFNYYVNGIRKTQGDPALKDRIYKCYRQTRH